MYRNIKIVHILPFFQERQLKWDQYREMASTLLMWLRDSTVSMLDRNFPHTLIEMKVRCIISNCSDKGPSVIVNVKPSVQNILFYRVGGLGKKTFILYTFNI